MKNAAFVAGGFANYKMDKLGELFGDSFAITITD